MEYLQASIQTTQVWVLFWWIHTQFPHLLSNNDPRSIICDICTSCMRKCQGLHLKQVFILPGKAGVITGRWTWIFPV